jgi:hypothetical protein
MVKGKVYIFHGSLANAEGVIVFCLDTQIDFKLGLKVMSSQYFVKLVQNSLHRSIHITVYHKSQ